MLFNPPHCDNGEKRGRWKGWWGFNIGGNLVHIVSHVYQCHGNYCERKELFLNYWCKVTKPSTNSNGWECLLCYSLTNKVCCQTFGFCQFWGKMVSHCGFYCMFHMTEVWHHFIYVRTMCIFVSMNCLLVFLSCSCTVLGFSFSYIRNILYIGSINCDRSCKYFSHLSILGLWCSYLCTF